MTRLLIALLVMMLCSGMQTVKAADLPVGERGDLHQWVACISKAEKRLAVDIVLDKPDALSKAFDAGMFFQLDCAPDRKPMRFMGLSFFGPMAEYVLRSTKLPKAQRDLAIVARELESASYAAVTQLKAFTSEQAFQLTFLGYLGICLHNRNPDAVTRLLQSNVQSDNELAVIDILSDDIQACRVPNYASRTTYDELRGAVATARFRIAHLAARKVDNA